MTRNAPKTAPEPMYTRTLLSAMVARFDAGDREGSRRCVAELEKRGVGADKIAAAWDYSKTIGTPRRGA